MLDANMLNSNITHYSYFGAFRSDVSNVGPNATMLTKNGKLTDIGSWYLGGQATHNIPSHGVFTIKSPDWMTLGWQFLALFFLFELCLGG
jgi:hypothetical protein